MAKVEDNEQAVTNATRLVNPHQSSESRYNLFKAAGVGGSEEFPPEYYAPNDNDIHVGKDDETKNHVVSCKI